VAEVVDRLESHQACERIDTRDACLVVPATGNQPSDESTVTVIVPRLVVAVEEIPANDVLSMTGLARTSALRIAPEAFPVDVLVIPVEAGINNRHDDRRAAALDKPPR